MFVLGIDGGGSKTLCVAADASGRVLSRAQGTGANPYASGEREVENLLRHLIGEASQGLSGEPAAICIGMAGVDRDTERSLLLALIRRLRVTAPVLIVNDALIALVAGIHDVPGIVIISGTGSIAYGRNARGLAARAGGWGYVLGDEGSGYWIGRRALSVVVRAGDGRGPATGLTPRLLAHYGVTRPQDLSWEVQRRDLRPPGIAALAIYVQRACEEGDAVAASIVAQAADELTLSAASVARRLGMDAGCPIVLAGTIFKAVPALTDALTRSIEAGLPQSRVSVLDREPAMGAVELALALLRGPVTVPEYA
jgi:N-acetylglucosamine kinase-like BadF-type ATPase